MLELRSESSVDALELAWLVPSFVGHLLTGDDQDLQFERQIRRVSDLDVVGPFLQP